LEPCSHFGKTPPCADLILKYKIPNVVIGTIDPNSKVAGKGIQKLKDSGVNVTFGILEKECNELNKRFFTFHRKSRPFIILKWAESSDGFISPKNRSEEKPVWISNEYSRQLVHKWRSEEQAILVGTQTIIDDNPSLTVRDWTGENPIRVIIDKENNVDSSKNVFDNQAKTIVFSSKEVNSNSETIQNIKIDFDINSTQTIVEKLYENNIQSIIIEGGSKTIQSFIDANIWDEARVFNGEIKLHDGTKAPEFKKAIYSKSYLKKDTLLTYRNDD
jgi:diaminohydroxyphosphoribosylaminopyrimidine deaminase/5-amino-6-(5-phosphoribosylamino)uracil reductase